MAKAKETGTDVAVKDEKAGALAAYDYGDYAGYEDNPESDELLIPFLSILQPMSPEITEADEDASPLLKPGNFINSVTGEITSAKDGLVIQPVAFQSMCVEWIPREKGGGIANRYQLHDPYVRQKMKDNGNSMVGLKEGENDLIETVYLYCNLLSTDGSEVLGFGVLPVKSTSLQPIKGFRTALQMIKGKPPVFAFKAVLSSEKKSNDSGTWWRLKVAPFGGATDWRSAMINPAEERELLDAGASLFTMIQQGEAKADFDQEANKTASDEKAQASPNKGGDDEVPF